jgi:hypothetical protein
MANPGPASQITVNLEAMLQPTFQPGRSIYPCGNLTAVTANGNGTMSFQYLPVEAPFTASRMDVLVGYSVASSATGNTWGLGITAIAGIYTNSNSSGGTASTGQSTLWSLSTASTATSYSVASNNSGNTALIQAAIRAVSVPLGATVFPGEYLVGVAVSTATISTGTATTALGITQSIYGGNQVQTASNFAPEFTNATNASLGLYGGMGVHSASQSAPLATYALSDILQTGANLSAANIALVFRNV